MMLDKLNGVPRADVNTTLPNTTIPTMDSSTWDESFLSDWGLPKPVQHFSEGNGRQTNESTGTNGNKNEIPGFDWQFYISYYDDLRSLTAAQAYQHWIQYGQNEGRYPCRDVIEKFLQSRQADLPQGFYYKTYLELHPDLQDAFGSNPYSELKALVHYFEFGQKEGRIYSTEVLEDGFDWKFYVTYHDDLRSLTAVQAYEHWIQYGRAEGRYSSLAAVEKFFQSRQADLPRSFYYKTYLDLNPWLQEPFAHSSYAEVKAIDHYLRYGQEEGRLYSTDGTVYYDHGQVLEKAGRVDEAVKFYRIALQLIPGHWPSSERLDYLFQQKLNADLQNLLEVYLQQLENLPTNLDIYRKILEFRNVDYVLCIKLAERLRQLDAYEEAAAFYRKAIAHCPDCVEIHLQLGSILLRLQQVEPAVQVFQHVLTLDPNHIEAHYLLGDALAELQSWERAIATYRYALELEEKNPSAVSTGLATASEEYSPGMQQEEDAIALYRRALELNPGSPWLHIALGESLANQGLLDEASNCYYQAIKLGGLD